MNVKRLESFLGRTRHIVLALMLVLSGRMALAQTAKNTVEKSNSDNAVDAILAKMSLEQKLGQFFLISVVGKKAPIESSVKILKQVPVGGILLFNYNLRGAPKNVATLNKNLQHIALTQGAALPYFIAVDQEGGRVQRLKRGFSILPSPRIMGQLPDKKLQDLGHQVGRELLTVGVNLNLAPVVEAAGGDLDVIGDRSFAADPKIAAPKAAAFIRGLQQADVLGTAKHFPGNAGSDVDPHKEMPTIDMSRSEIQSKLLPPFRAAIDAGVDAIMVAHVRIPALDKKHPVALSQHVIQDLLRQDLGFKGLICSDDLLMGAVTHHFTPSEAAILAVQAGTDLLMVSNPAEVPAMHQALLKAVADGRISVEQVDASVRRIVQKKIQRHLRKSARALDSEKNLRQLARAKRKTGKILQTLASDEANSKAD